MGILKETYREQNLSVLATSTNEVDFFNTNPNFIHVRNFTTDTIYIGFDPTVSSSNYRMSVITGGTRRLLLPTHFKQLYIYSVASGNIVLASGITTEPTTQELDETQTSVIVNSTVTSSVIATEGGILGSKAESAQTNPASTTSSIIQYIKGILSTILSVISSSKVQVDVKTIPALGTGSNVIGNVGLEAGTNNIGDVDVASLPALPTGSNTIGNVGLVAGSNTIGNVNLNHATTVTIYNVTMTNADTEYNQALPANTKGFSFAVRDGTDSYNYRLAFATGKVATPTEPYVKRLGNVSVEKDNLSLTSPTLYFACSSAGKVAEIVAYSI